MAKIDLLTVMDLTANDGSVVSSGATLKFNTEFFAASTNVRITPKLYRNRELFETGYGDIRMSENILPVDFIIEFVEEDFYSLTPVILYEEVKNWLNNHLGGTYFELNMIL